MNRILHKNLSLEAALRAAEKLGCNVERGGRKAIRVSVPGQWSVLHKRSRKDVSRELLVKLRRRAVEAALAVAED